jgi:hypothetical protein
MDKEERKLYNKKYYALKTLDRQKCCLCGKHFIPYGFKNIDASGVEYLDVKRGHISCLKLIEKKDKIKDALLNTEFLIFSKIQE